MLTDLFVKEFLYIVVLAAVGIGFTAFLPRPVSAGTRLALAPAFGLAAACGLLTTVNFFVPLNGALWFALLPLAAVSLAVAWRLRAGYPSLRDLAQFALVTGLIFVVFNAPLRERQSDGPIAYGVADAPGYIHCIEGFAHHTTREPLTSGDSGSAFSSHPGAGAWKPLWNLSARYCWAYEFQHSASMTVPAAVASSVGWYSWQALSPWMVVVVMVTALAAVGLFRVITRSSGWIGAAAGAAAGTPLLQPFIDGSAGILSALALVPAVIALVVLAIECLNWRTTALIGVLLAGMAAVYPEVGIVLLAGVALQLLGLLIYRLRRGDSLVALARKVLPHLLVAGALALLLFPRATLWLWANAKIASGVAAATGVDYDMAPQYVIGWLFQTRDFYEFALGGGGGAGQLVLGTILPLILLGAVIYGAIRLPRARILIAVAVAAVLQAVYLNRTSGCTYCVDRSLLPIIPLVGVALFIGLWELARAPGRGRREAAGVLAGMFLVAACASVIAIEHRAIRGAYMPSSDTSSLVSAVHDRVDGTLAIEGWDQTQGWAWSQNPTMYAAITQATGQRVAAVTAYNDYGGYGYLHTRPIGDPSYTANYRYVATRLTGLDAGRQLVYRTRDAAVQRRAGEFDALLARGAAVESYRQSRNGIPYLAPGSSAPLTFWISAQSSRPAYLRLWLGAVGLRPTMSQAVARDIGQQSYLCVPVPGTGPRRIVELPFPSAPGRLSPPFGNDQTGAFAPIIEGAVPLRRVRVGATPC